jgi:capsular exopolysaccharide synthesis family protein
MRRALRIRLEGAGDYAHITAKAGEPGQAAALANAVADSYVRQMSEKREAAIRRAVTWLNQQIYELRGQSTEKEQAASDLIAQGLNPRMFESSSDGKEASTLSQLEDQIRDTRIELVAATQRLAEISPSGTGQKVDPDEAASLARLQKQFEEETANLEAARLKYTPTHPEVRRLEETVAGLAARVGPTDSGRSNSVLATDMAEYQSLKRERSKLQAKLAVLERSRDAEIGQGQKSEAYGRYRRLQSEIAVDREMLGLLLSRRNETMVASAKQDTGARVLDAAVPPLYAAGLGKTQVLGLAWLAAIAAGFAVAGLLELLDRRVRDPERIARVLGMSVLCSLPVLPAEEAVPERQGGLPPGSIGSERYRSLRTALVFAMRMRKVHTLLVTSGIQGEGKTTTSANLAAAFARMGKKLVLIDADMRRPRLHRVFGAPRAPGLSEVLTNKARLADALLRPTNEEFDLLPAGALPDNPTDLLASGAWSDLIAELKQEYELVLIDSPVVLAVPDPLLLAAEADGLVLVHKPGSLERRGLVQLRDDLRMAGARPLGVVFNQVDRHDPDLYPAYLESPYLKTSDGKRQRRKAV